MLNIGFKHTEETKKRMSLSQKGRKHSEETKLKISLANKGRIFSETHKKNLKDSITNLWTRYKHPMTGKHHSKETKNKMRLSKLGKKMSIESKQKMSLLRMGDKNIRWNGGKRIHKEGYIYIRAPKNHPTQHHDGYILEHRLVMEKYLGRLLKRKEIVHHINEDVSDNRIENLMLFPNVTAHLNYHRQMVK